MEMSCASTKVTGAEQCGSEQVSLGKTCQAEQAVFRVRPQFGLFVQQKRRHEHGGE